MRKHGQGRRLTRWGRHVNRNLHGPWGIAARVPDTIAAPDVPVVRLPAAPGAPASRLPAHARPACRHRRCAVKLAANLSLLYPGLDLPARMQAAARDGFEGVEILFPYDLAPQALAEALQCNGLALALINTPPGPNGEKGLAGLPGRQADFRAGLQQALDVCRATGCRAIHVMAGAVPEGQSRPACLQALADNLRQAAPLAAERGVTLTLE